MADDLSRLEAWAAALLGRLSAPERRRALRALATALRRSQAERIARQQAPDGSPFPERKARPEAATPARARKGRIRKRAKAGPMFRKLRVARWLAAESSPDEAAVTFRGSAIRIARVHQFGLRDRVAKNPAAPETTYARRPLLGFSAGDEQLVARVLAEQLGGR